MRLKISMPLIAALVILYPYQPIKVEQPKLTCTISSVKSVYKVGEVPEIQVKIINEGNSDVYLIGSLDGSDAKRRMPHCYFTLQKPVPGPDTPLTGRCATLNPLRKEDLILVKAGSSFDPYATIDWYGFVGNNETLRPAKFNQPGTYTIQFHYNSNSGNFNKFRGTYSLDNEKDSALLQPIFSKAAKVELTSNKLEICYEQ